MSKYEPLWKWIAGKAEDATVLSFDEIGKITGFPVYHSFLTFKKELTEYGYRAGKISMNKGTVTFEKTEEYERRDN